MIDVNVQKKREFTIHCTADGGVDITNGDGKKGGNIKTRPRRKLTWTNDTQHSICYLAFRQMSLDEIADVGPLVWPFEETPPQDSLLALPKGVPTEGTLLDFRTVTHIEYVVLGADTQPLLDPVIIIEPN
jgi:hypothetical protein